MKNKCSKCAHHNQESMWCSILKTKKADDETCKAWASRSSVKQELVAKSTQETKKLDALVTWMRLRGVAALKSGTVAITLASMVEPSATAPEQDEQQALTREEVLAKQRMERAMLYYQGGLPQRKVE